MATHAEADPASTTPATAEAIVISVVTYKWTPKPGYRSQFGPETVNVLRRMVRRHYPHPHRFICVTDDPNGITEDVEIVPLWNDFADLPSPHGGKNPSCYRRLRAFSPEIANVYGNRFVSMDLDCVVTGDLTPLFNRPEEFVAYGDTNPQPGSHYNGSLLLMTAGARRKVWDDFDPKTSPQKALAARCFGSDQAWISYCLGKGEAKWSKADGVYSYRNDLQGRSDLPINARLIIFHGCHDPWGPRAQRLEWVQRCYQ